VDRSLTNHRHLESLRTKLTSRVALLRRLAGATTLRTATLGRFWSFQNSTAEYCAPVWCRSAHTRLIDPATNDALRTVTGWLRPIPTDNLPMLAGIQTAELRCRGATPSLARRSMKPGHLSANIRHLKWRHPFVPAAQQLISSSDDNGRSAALWADHRWNADRLESTTRLRTFTPYPSPWNSPATKSVGPSPVCTNGTWLLLWVVSGAKKIKPLTMLSSNFQSIDLPMDCTLRAWLVLTVLGDETIDWLLNTCPNI